KQVDRYTRRHGHEEINVSEKKPLHESQGEKGKRGFEDAVQTLNGFMSFVRRQRGDFQEFGDKKISESQMDYDVTLFEEESE
ncbi:MAG TPA: hypothetical protein VK206_18500, partial [Anaerolineales bacterium]|nr:hypothetical protein [Anaerolineales bacterium]